MVPHVLAPPKKRRARRNPKRAFRVEALEQRRLMIAEGSPFELSQTFDTSGVSGNISAEINWGDGQTTVVNNLGSNAAGNINVKYDYSRDFSNFFTRNAEAKPALDFATKLFTNLFADELAATGRHAEGDVRANILDPATGDSVRIAENLNIRANEVIIYAATRNFDNEPGLGTGVAAIAGPGSLSFRVTDPATFFQCGNLSQNACNAAAQAKLDGIQDELNARGQDGALGDNADDYAVSVGSIAFDEPRDWYFGTDPSGIERGQTDFISIAIHELAHVFGFGLADSWKAQMQGGRFTGSVANQAYVGSGNVPVSGEHWHPSVLDNNDSNLTPTVVSTTRSLSPLDLGGLIDIGWEQIPSTRIELEETHVYGDDGDYSVQIVLLGSDGGRVTIDASDVNVTNVAPELTTADDQTVELGQPITIMNIGSITDPGFATPDANPASEETFDYTIDWGDGSEDSGTATITGGGGTNNRPTTATFDGTHTYDTEGNKTVTLRVVDDDNGVVESTLRIQVTPPPAPPSLDIEFSQAAVDENAGSGELTLTVTRAGAGASGNQRILLSSSDTSEIDLPPNVLIPNGDDQATIDVSVVDDALLDGDIEVEVTATFENFEPDTASVTVRDYEELTATLSSNEITEGGSKVNLTVRRSNTDVESSLVIAVTGAPTSQVDIGTEITIPQGDQEVTVEVASPDDDAAEAPRVLQLRFRNDDYETGAAELTVIDDEPAAFQRQENRFDVNGQTGVTANDALIVINEIARRAGNVDLNPADEPPGDSLFDVNGDYRVTALDALQIINQLAVVSQSEDEEEQASGEQLLASVLPVRSEDTDDEDAWDQMADEALRQMF